MYVHMVQVVGAINAYLYVDLVPDMLGGRC